jgi:hypothetical protein
VSRDSANAIGDPAVTRKTGATRSEEPRFDRNRTLHMLRNNLARADAMITAAERLIEEPLWHIRGDEGDDADEDEDGDSISRRRNQVAHLIESAKLAVRAAIYTGTELDRHRGGA